MTEDMTEEMTEVMTEENARELLSCNPRRPILGGLLRYFYGSSAAIRDGPFSGPVFATSMAPQLQSATAHSREASSLLL